MKITGVEIYRLQLPTDNWMLVTLETNENMIGWGEITGSCDDDGLAGLIEEFKKQLIGKDPLDLMECMQLLHRWSYPALDKIRTFSTAISGIDQALWDINAKYRKLPLYKLLGGAEKRSILLYANLNKALQKNRSPEALHENVLKAKNCGFRIFKCTPFDEINPTNPNNDLTKGFERLKAVAGLVDMPQIAIDCHQRFERYTLARMVEKLLSDYGQPYWIEDPVDSQNDSALQYVQNSYPGVRWAAGEDALNFQQFYNTMKINRYEILMPDLKYIGGPSVVRSMIPFAEGVGFKVSLHNPNGIIATAFSAHLSTLSKSEMPLEFPFAAVADRELLSDPREMVRDGSYLLSDEPGIGVEISQDAMLEYALRYSDGHWSKFKK